jgi:hypothetical protein
MVAAASSFSSPSSGGQCFGHLFEYFVCPSKRAAASDDWLEKAQTFFERSTAETIGTAIGTHIWPTLMAKHVLA